MDFVISQDFFPRVGGAHLWLYEVYKRWPSSVTLLTQDYSKDRLLFPKQLQFDLLDHGNLKLFRKDLYIDDISIYKLSCIRKYVTNLREMKNHIADSYPSIHCIRAFPEGIAAVLFKTLLAGSAKIITYAHGEELLTAMTSRQLRFLSKWVYSKSDLIIANSRSTEKLVRGICSRVNIKVIHPGVNPNAFRFSIEKRNAFRANWGWPENTIVLVTISRMEARKNHSLVIDAVAALRQEGLPLAYIIGGDGDEMDNLSSKVHNLRLNDWIRFTGYLSDEDRALTYAAADIHILPSIKLGPMIEGFGIVFLEAAAAGIPSISGNVGGQPEAVLNGHTGFVVNAVELSEITSAIRTLAESKSLRRHFGTQGLTWATENEWDKVVARIYRAIEHNGILSNG